MSRPRTQDPVLHDGGIDPLVYAQAAWLLEELPANERGEDPLGDLDVDALLGADETFAEVCDARREAWLAAIENDLELPNTLQLEGR